MKKKILVTGPDGFIGSHLSEVLVRAGYNVCAFVLYNSFSSWGWLDHCASELKGKFEALAGDVRLWAANTNMQELLGWEPQYGSREGFLRGLIKTIAWFRMPANLSGYKADVYNM